VNIQPIVEGHGDVAAVPILLRRLIAAAQAYSIEVNRPIRKKQTQLLREASLRDAVRLARIQEKCGAILVIFEAEDGCPAQLGPQLAAWAQAEAGNVPCLVALPHREYEAWFLAAIESLRGCRGIRDDAVSHPDPESVRDAKGQVEARMHPGAYYLETSDQAALSRLFDLATAYSQSRSFRHLVGTFGSLVRAMGVRLDPWPPESWQVELH
jgi:hypothetical protein